MNPIEDVSTPQSTSGADDDSEQQSLSAYPQSVCSVPSSYCGDHDPLHDLHTALATSFISQALQLAQKEQVTPGPGLNGWSDPIEACVEDIYRLPAYAFVPRREVLRRQWAIHDTQDPSFQPPSFSPTRVRCSIRAEYNPLHHALRYRIKTLQSRRQASDEWESGSALQQLTYGTPHSVQSPIASGSNLTRPARVGPSCRKWKRPRASGKSLKDPCSVNTWTIDLAQSSPSPDELHDTDVGNLDILWERDDDFATLIDDFKTKNGGSPDRSRPLDDVEWSVDEDALKELRDRLKIRVHSHVVDS